MKSLFVFLCFVTCLQNDAQSQGYLVFLVKGNVMASKPGGIAVVLKQNAFLDNDQVITLQKNEEVTLADKEQNFYVLKSPGIYKVKGLNKIPPDPISGVTKTYLKIAWNELVHSDHDFQKFKNENSSLEYGGVSRGDDCNNLIYPIQGLKTSEDSLHFKWHQTSPASKYELIIYDSKGAEAMKMPVADTQKTISMSEALHAVPGNYYWLVKGENGGCEEDVPVFFELMTKENEQKLIASILKDNNESDFTGRFNAINKLIKNALIPAALKDYSELANAYPDNATLVKSYVLLLLKYGYDEEAYDVWEKLKI